MDIRKLILIHVLICYSATVFARVNSSYDSIPLTRSLSEIGNHYNVRIYYKPVWIKDIKTLMPEKYSTLNADLDYVLKGLPFSYTVYMNKYIIIYKDLSALSKNYNSVQTPGSKISYRLAGRVLDEKDDTPVPGATVYIQELDTGTITFINGSFSFTLPEGNYTFEIKSVGYVVQNVPVQLGSNTTKNFYLPDEVRQLNEVVISGRSIDNVVESSMGISVLNMKSLKVQPALMGEADVIKSLLLLPGVSTVGEAASGFNVRGGSADQNLVIMDEAPLFNTSHVFGLFSSFNQDITDNVTLIRSGIPPRYGGRISSVLDVRTKSDQANRFNGEGGVSLFDSRLLMEIPVIKDKLTLLAGGRSLYSDYLLRLVRNPGIKNSSAFFYDGNLKMNYRLNNSCRLYYSFYSSLDRFHLPTDTAYDWGSQNHSLIFSQLIGKKLAINATGVWANYHYGFEGEISGDPFQWKAGIQYKNAKMEFYYVPGSTNRIDFGASLGWYKFIPGSLETGPSSIISPIEIDDMFADEKSVYINDEFDVFPFLRIMAGVRYSLFSQVGPGTVHLYEDGKPRNANSLIGSEDYVKGEKISENSGFEPRIAIRIKTGSLSSLKLSYNRIYQYIQQISNTAGITPIDLWLPSGVYLKPQQCDQISLGYFRNFNLNTFETSAEVYYKFLENQIDYKNGAELYLNPSVETELLQGIGKAYGIEFYVKKNLGRLTGWISYSWSRSLKKISGNTLEQTINNGMYYPSNYDIPNDFKITANYKVNRRWYLAGNFIYNTGRPVTYPISKFEADDIPVAKFSPRNLERIPDYNRLDLSVTLRGNNRRNKHWDSNWTFTLYNVYGRKNAYSLFFKPVPGTGLPQVYKYTVLGTIIPSLSYNFRFI